MIRKIDEGLYQTGTLIWEESDVPPDVDVVLFCAKVEPAMVPEGGTTLVFQFEDSERGVPPDKWEALVHLCASIADQKVMTVCQAGENRSGLASALVLIGRGVAVWDAVKKVQSSGKTIITEFPGPLWNRGFVDQLLLMKDAP